MDINWPLYWNKFDTHLYLLFSAHSIFGHSSVYIWSKALRLIVYIFFVIYIFQIFFGARNYVYTYRDNYPIWSEVVKISGIFSDHYECFNLCLRLWLCHLSVLFWADGHTKNVWRPHVIAPGGSVHYVLKFYEFFQILFWADLLGTSREGDTGVYKIFSN